MLLARFLLNPETATLVVRSRQAMMISALGALEIVLARTPGIRQYARAVVLASGLIASGILIWSSFLVSAQSTSPNDFIPGEITLVMLIAVATSPLRPMQTLLFGMGIGVVYYVEALIAERTLLEGLGPDENYLLFIVMLAFLSTGIAAVLYRQRRTSFDNHKRALRAANDLRKAQTRILLTENAVSLSRLAAAVSHEMNNPLGAMLSGVDTLLLLAGRQATAPPEEHPRLVKLQADIRRSIQESAGRLKELVARMQRFINLDESELTEADLNEIVRESVGLVDPALRKRARLEMRLEPLPRVVCRPQQMAAVFSGLLRNALQAVNGSGRVTVSSAKKSNTVRVEFQDNGHGLSPEELRNIFDPAFRETDGRVAAGNWSMFNSRQVIREQGGDIAISSDEGRGTNVVITFPLTETAEVRAVQ